MYPDFYIKQRVNKEYTLFHKDYPVATLNLDEYFNIEKINEIHNAERLPVGLYTKQLNKNDLNNWLFGRAIPEKREGLSIILQAEKVKSNRELLIKNYGLGLSDCYWIKPFNTGSSWKEVNFFENPFNEQGDNIYLGENLKNNNHKMTPNGVSSGMLPKKWIITDNERYLVKGSEQITNQEPFNEVIASRFLKALDIPHVHYDYYWIKKKPYSICGNMLGKDEELISAYYVSNVIKKDNRNSYLRHYAECCRQLGLTKNVNDELSNMIIIDYIMANTDRHWSNFGIIRDSETLKIKRLAPLYDNGASFYNKTATIDIGKENARLKCSSFCSTQKDNIKLVTDFSLLGKKEIHDLPEIIRDEMKNNKYIDEDRINEISFRIKSRINTVCKRY